MTGVARIAFVAAAFKVLRGEPARLGAMPHTVAELDLLSELEKLRTDNLIHAVLDIERAVDLRDVRTPRDAIYSLLRRAIRLLRALPVDHLDATHPAMGALSTLLQHAEADGAVFGFLPVDHRARVAAQLPLRVLPWSAAQLEWQLVQYVTMAGEDVPFDPGRTFAEQTFDSPTLSEAWKALLDLTVFRMNGLMPAS